MAKNRSLKLLLFYLTMGIMILSAKDLPIVWPRYVPESVKRSCLADSQLKTKLQEIESLRLKASKEIDKSSYSATDMKNALSKIQADGSHSDMDKDLVLTILKQIKFPNPQKQVIEKIQDDVAVRLCSMLRYWHHHGRDGNVKKKLLRSIVYYLRKEWERHVLPPHNRWCSQCMLMPTLATEAYFCFFDDMVLIESGKCSDKELQELHRLIMLVAPQCFSEQQRGDVPNPLCKERFQKHGAWCGGNFGYRPLYEAALVCRNPKMIEVIVEVCSNALEPVSWNTKDSAFWIENMTYDGGGWGHGSQAYIHGYPLSGVLAVMKNLRLLSGTIFMNEIETEKIMNAVRFSEGNLWYCYGLHYHGYTLMAPGRISMRAGDFFSSRSAMFLAKDALELLPRSATEERAYAQKILDIWELKEPEPSGTRYFWNCESMIHRRPDYYVGVNMVSSRKHSTEVCHYDTRCTEFLCDGSTFIMKRPDQHHKVKGFWDFSAIPGTTVRRCSFRTDYENGSGFLGRYNFAGGVVREGQGVSGFIYGKAKQKHVAHLKLDVYGVTAHKSYFFFEDLLVCLGSGIFNEIPSNPVRTCLDQVEYRGRALEFSGDGGRTVEKISGPFLRKGTNCDFRAVHDGVGYAVLQEQTSGSALSFSLEERQDKWMTLFPKVNQNRPKRPRRLSVLQMIINHGVKPQNGSDCYGYVVALRCANMDTLNQLLHKNPPVILSNTRSCQAIRRGKTTMALFYVPTSFEDIDGTWSSSHPAVVIIERLPKNKVRIIASDPRQDSTLKSVKIGYAMNAEKSRKTTEFSIDLPQGGNCGAQSEGTFILR